jgi:hypothetical protein
MSKSSFELVKHGLEKSNNCRCPIPGFDAFGYQLLFKMHGNMILYISNLRPTLPWTLIGLIFSYLVKDYGCGIMRTREAHLRQWHTIMPLYNALRHRFIPAKTFITNIYNVGWRPVPSTSVRDRSNTHTNQARKLFTRFAKLINRLTIADDILKLNVVKEVHLLTPQHSLKDIQNFKAKVKSYWYAIEEKKLLVKELCVLRQTITTKFRYNILPVHYNLCTKKQYDDMMHKMHYCLIAEGTTRTVHKHQRYCIDDKLAILEQECRKNIRRQGIKDVRKNKALARSQKPVDIENKRRRALFPSNAPLPK